VPSVAVAVLTYRRTAQLARMLPEVETQVGSLDGWTGSVIVVDNDPRASASPVIADRESTGAVRYVHEPRIGIAAARNRALAEASADDVLVFIDDDELPGRHWLRNLVTCWEQWQCAAVSGPVRSEFAADPGRWVLGSGMFTRRRRPTGSTVSGAPTNNLLLDMAVVRAHQLRFDERFGVSGGEDTHFARALRDAGGTIRWCDEAEVVEPVAPERATRTWVLRRAFRTGTTWSAVELARTAPSRRWLTRLTLVGRAGIRAAQAVAQLAVAALTGSTHRRAQAEVLLAARAGMLVGAGGYQHAEYRRPAFDR
jgi:succinoglycan biosynthesis protein ExoM